MANNPSSGSVVKTGGGNGGYIRNRSGWVQKNTGGDANTNIPAYSSPSLNYSTPLKSNVVGDVVQAPSG